MGIKANKGELWGQHLIIAPEDMGKYHISYAVIATIKKDYVKEITELLHKNGIAEYCLVDEWYRAWAGSLY